MQCNKTDPLLLLQIILQCNTLDHYEDTLLQKSSIAEYWVLPTGLCETLMSVHVQNFCILGLNTAEYWTAYAMQ